MAFYDNKPSIWEAVGNGSYLYRWNIQEITPEQSENDESEKKTTWQCEEVTVWPPYDTGSIINAVIRASYTAEAEIALVNKYNAYQQGMNVGADIVSEYSEYLAFVQNVKQQVRKDFDEETPAVQSTGGTPRLSDIAAVLSMTVNTLAISDEQALRVKSIYPRWESLVGEAVKKDDKMQYDGKLWKVLQDHTAQEQWKPGKGTESLYTEIVESAKGTKDDPIPYDNNMELFKGKYYSQGGKVYLCIRDTGIPVYNTLAELVGNYVELVK